MNYLKQIHLINWQRHNDLTLDFTNGINVISGETDCGKSCIYRALEWVYNFSNVAEADYRKEGTKETSVEILLNSGYSIKRIRSNSINRYILKKSGCEDKVFDTFGRTTPEEIQKVLRINSIDIEAEHLNLNFANQDQLNFILDSVYSDTFKAKLFNKLTGNELLDVLFKSCNKENGQVNRDIKSLEVALEKQETELSDYTTKYKKLKKKCKNIKDKFDAIQEDLEIYNYLVELSETLENNTTKKSEVNKKLKEIKTVSQDTINSLKEEANHLNKLVELFQELKAVNKSLKSIKDKKTRIKDVKIDFNKLKQDSEKLRRLEDLNTALNDNTEILQTATIDIKALTDILKKNEKKLKDIWTTQKACPLCKRELK